MAQVLVFLPSIREIWTEFLAPDLDLVQSQFLQVFEEKINEYSQIKK